MSRTTLSVAALLLTASAAVAQTYTAPSTTAPSNPMSSAPSTSAPIVPGSPMSNSSTTQMPAPQAAPLTAVPPASPNRSPTVATGDSKNQTTPVGQGAVFAVVPTNDELSSKLIGLEIYNSAKQNIGEIKDISFNAGVINAYIVAVGGFLGMGEHYVAIRPSAVNLSYDASAKKWRATMDTTAAQLKAAPQYKYANK